MSKDNTNKDKAKNTDKYLIIFAIFIIGFSLGKVIEINKTKKLFSSIKQIRLPNEEYPLVNRLIGTEMPEATNFFIFTDIKNKLSEEIKEEESRGFANNISFYFRDLNTGLWFGINETEEYIPASLFKLPISIAYFKMSTYDESLFEKRLIYTKELDEKLKVNAGLESSELKIGNSYTVKELIRYMLIDSDNGAKVILEENINKNILDEVFSLSHVTNPNQNNYFISPKEYASFLRIIYNGSYLGVKGSNELLSILSEVKFNEGIRRAIPKDIMVIHKFGSVNLKGKTPIEDKIGFNHCGIVYYPEKPFIVCFMTTGEDQKRLAEVVERLTKKLLKYIEK